MSANDFYEEYWQDSGSAIPEKDPTVPQRLKFLRRTLKEAGQVKKVLDAGCGSGIFTSAIKKAGYEVVGMDISENAIFQARKRHPDLQFVCHGLDTPWPFEDNAFDAIFAGEVIEHVFGLRNMFSEINRTLKPGGLVILTTPYHGLIKNLLIVILNFNRHFNDLKGGHIRFFTKESLINLLKEFGFMVTGIKYIGRIRPIAKGIYIVAKKKVKAEKRKFKGD